MHWSGRTYILTSIPSPISPCRGKQPPPSSSSSARSTSRRASFGRSTGRTTERCVSAVVVFRSIFRRPGRDEYSFFGGGLLIFGVARASSQAFAPDGTPPHPCTPSNADLRRSDRFDLCFSSSFVSRPSFSPFPTTGLRRRDNFRSGHRGIYTKNRNNERLKKKSRRRAQRGRTIGHNQWTWAMEKRDDRVAIFRANNAKKD